MKKLIIFLILIVAAWTIKAQVKSKNVNVNRPLQKSDLEIGVSKVKILDQLCIDDNCVDAISDTGHILATQRFVEVQLTGIETTPKTIYVEEYPTGNDTTADGSVGAPYHSILGAMNSLYPRVKAEIIIQLGAGEFNWGQDEAARASLFELTGADLVIKGTRQVIISSVSLAYDDTLSTTYTATKAGVTLTADSLFGLFVEDNAKNIWPITWNSAGTDSWRMEMAKAGNNVTKNIVELTSIINLTNEFAMSFDLISQNRGLFYFSNVFFKCPDEMSITYVLQPKYIENSKIEVVSGIILGGYSNAFFSQLSIKNSLIYCTANSYTISARRFIGCLELKNTAVVNTNLPPSTGAVPLGIDAYDGATVILTNVVCRGNNKYTDALKLQHSPIIQIRKTFTARDCHSAIGFEAAYIPVAAFIYYSKNYEPGDILLANTDNVFDEVFNGLKVSLNDIYSNDPAGFKLYGSGRFLLDDQDRGINVNFNCFPYSQAGSDTVALIDNSTTYINIGDSIYNKTMTIEYSTTRGTSIEMNTLKIINKRSAVSVAEGTLTGDDVGLSFAVGYNNGLIRLACTLTSTGSNANFQYRVRRIMY